MNFGLPFYHHILAFLGALVYGFPSRKLIVVGVTGTKGKSSVVYLVSRILNEAGIKTGAVGSIEWRVGNEALANPKAMTMPGRFAVQKMLRKMVDAGCEAAILEVTSEGIKQSRHKFIDFDAAVFTNLRPEHIESHGSFEKYRAAKLKLFEALAASRARKKFKGESFDKTIIVNLDDENAGYFLDYGVERKIGYQLKTQNEKLKITTKNLKVEEYSLGADDIQFVLDGQKFLSPLMGAFNLYNILAAMAVVKLFGVPDEQIKLALLNIKFIPGRMEFIGAGQPFRIIVDYAHTLDSMKAVLSLMSKFKIQNSKLLCVFGSAGGGRDKWKRPEMGKVAVEYCDKIILTTDDPYDEDPKKIVSDIQKGIPVDKIQLVEIIIDRTQAIRKALQSARSGDIVAILGRGSEEYMRGPNGALIPWSDNKEISEAIKTLGRKAM